MTEKQQDQKMTEQELLAILEEYLHQPLRGMSILPAGFPRSSNSCPLTNALKWKDGDEWQLFTNMNTMALYRRKQEDCIASFERGESILYRFIELIDALHPDKPGKKRGQVRFWEARLCLQQAKQG